MSADAQQKLSSKLDAEEHPLALSIALHLWPGLLVSAVYLAIVQPLTRAGFPPLFALLVAYTGIIPAELGVMLLLGKKRNDRWSLKGIVLFREKIPAKRYLLYIPLLTVVAGALFFAMAPLADWLFTHFFGWVPEWALLDRKGQTYATSALTVTVVAAAVLVVGVYPVIEEMYFRGFLMPRMSRFGNGTIVWSSLLFGVYHFLEPWSLPARFVVLLPVLYVVLRTRNIYIAIVVHALGNVAAVVAVAKMLNQG
jgi:membrane protease YdiL (CAAX protease family)